MGSTCRVAFVFAMSMLLMAKARPLDLRKATRSDLLARLKLDEESPYCWDSLIQLQSCTGELIMFFLNGETEIGQSCCRAIRTVSRQCWPNMIDTLGFTTQETHIVEGYCNHEDDQSMPSVDVVTNDAVPSKSLDP
ncbi:EGG CELL 1.1 [Hibiscus trionum]|uniref:EGG CELL 1.1 n=1 Tax=Hibiscus trionum TaxID=183268 RepID=A0A9W7IAS6_HIBTR|nr:EGG CELL 1.1 [Hibiscus trionum]